MGQPQNWAPIGLVLLLLFLLVMPTIASFLGNNTGAAILGAVGAAAIILTRLPDVLDFELFALRVKLREQSKQVEITLEQLQTMATAFAGYSLAELAVSGQTFRRLNPRAKFDLHDKIIESLKSIKTPESKISELQETWKFVNCRMILDSVRASVAQLLPDSETWREIDNLPKSSEHALPTPQAVRKWITDKSLNDPGLTELLNEFENVQKTGSMKNPSLILDFQVMGR